GDFSDQPHKAVIQPSEVIEVAGEILDRISIRHYGYDPTMAPNGKSVLIITFKASYDYWKKLRGNRVGYNKEKKQVADQIIKELANRFPGIAEKIEAIDVATPVTYERYTANWKGAIEGWLVTPDTIGMAMADGMGKTLPGLKNFYMAGQWVEPGGGIPPAAISGKKVIEMICKQDGKPFKALKS
ncbi:MAG: NAD(P)/FAD-dependent oxidoreductase, partial [Proteobacteria bacterium]|nr:NAD(P)/FAD-dependent oxidoreductase [Pseudomonadota bacterium]MBU1710083.1 NAD(P)/FAD-dependent oxidoreductase [Pseudomonadota bacterium]